MDVGWRMSTLELGACSALAPSCWAAGWVLLRVPCKGPCKGFLCLCRIYLSQVMRMHLPPFSCPSILDICVSIMFESRSGALQGGLSASPYFWEML